MVLRVKLTPTRFPTNSLYIPTDNTLLHSISSVCNPCRSSKSEREGSCSFPHNDHTHKGRTMEGGWFIEEENCIKRQAFSSVNGGPQLMNKVLPIQSPVGVRVFIYYHRMGQATK